MKRQVLHLASIILLILPAAILFFFWISRADNKFSMALPASSGVSFLTDGEAGQASFLVDGWEYYPGQLLEPEDFPAEEPVAIPVEEPKDIPAKEPVDSPEALPQKKEIYIGQYPNFSTVLGSPYGTVTYRILLRYDGSFQALSLFLPEALSASRVFINGRDCGGSGSVNPYRPLIQDRLYSFPAAPVNEIVIQTANYSHYYSGLYYPPAVGSPQAVASLMSWRTAFYGFLCFGSLAVALSNLAMWASRRTGSNAKPQGRCRDRLPFLFGCLCTAFSIQTAYPFFLMAGVHAIRPFYAVMDLCGSLVLLCAILITGILSFHETPVRENANLSKPFFSNASFSNASFSKAGHSIAGFHRAFVLPAAAAMCAAAVIFPVFILPHAPALINFYGTAVSVWKLLASLWLTAAALYGLKNGRRLAGFLLAAALAYGLCIGFSVLSINRFEPAIGGWPEEYGGLALVLVFAAMMVRRSKQMMEENERLNKNLEKEVAKKTAELAALLEGRKKFLADIVHDLKTPLAAIKSYGELIRFSETDLDEETSRYLDSIQDRMELVGERFELLRTFSAKEQSPLTPAPLSLNEFLTRFHRSNQPDIEMDGHQFLLRMPAKELVIAADADALRRILENLCYNALAFSPPESVITLSLSSEEEKKMAVITVSDTGRGISPEDLPHIFERNYHKREGGDAGHGLGLYIARALVVEQGGTIEAASAPGAGTRFTLRFAAR